MPAPISTGPSLAGPVAGVTAPSGAPADPDQFGMALATLLGQLAGDPSGETPDEASAQHEPACSPSTFGPSVPSPEWDAAVTVLPATPNETTRPPIEDTPSAIESAVLGTGSAVAPFDSAAIAIDSGVVPIDSAAIVIENAVVPIDSAVLGLESAVPGIESTLPAFESAVPAIGSALPPAASRSEPVAPILGTAGVPAPPAMAAGAVTTVPSAFSAEVAPPRETQRVTTPGQESALVAAPQVAGTSPPLAAPANAAPVTAVPVPPGFAAQLARPMISLAAGPPGEHVVTVRVTPENLGPVTVRAHIGSDGVRIELFAPTEVGRAAVHAVLSDLRRDLAGTGLDASLDLSDRGAPARDPAFGEDRERSGASAGHQGDSRSLPQTASTGPGSARAAHLPSLSTAVRLDVLA